VTGLAFVLVWAALLVPDDVRRLSVASLFRIPVEGLAVAALLLALSAGASRWSQVAARTVALTLGTLLGLALLLKVADFASYQALDRPAHPVTDAQVIAAGLDYVRQGYGSGAAAGAVVGAVLLVVVLLAGTSWCATRVGATLRRRRTGAVRVVVALAVTWTVLAPLGVTVGGGQPAAAHSLIATTTDQVARARGDLSDEGRFARQLAASQTAEESAGASGAAGSPAVGAVPLGALRGKDVVVVFVESYGRTALEDPVLGPGVDAVLDAGMRELRAAGFSARSGFLTSATFGGRSWLGHSTLLSGTWVDSQARYDTLLAGTHPTLVSDFGGAGWRTVSLMPATARDWPEGAFYGYRHIYFTRELAYRGPAFAWSPMPDQFVLSRLQALELGKKRTVPVFATVELTSSHNPWAPLPTAVPWAAVGDGTVFAPQPRRGRQPAEVWSDPAQVRTEYGHAIEYSVSTVLSFVRQYAMKDTVVIFVGDHQPVKAVTGEGASHDVPMAIVAKDPAVLQRLSSWGWADGVHPGPDAPVWPMDAFRARFLQAFAAVPGAPG
jgi:hypothetical protein